MPAFSQVFLLKTFNSASVLITGRTVSYKFSSGFSVTDSGGGNIVVSITSTPAGGVVGGVQFNDAGTLNGVTTFVFDKVKNSLNLGSGNTVSATNAFAQGTSITITAPASSGYGQGAGHLVSGVNGHAEGGSNTVSGNTAHGEGGATTASGDFSHSEGNGSTASGTNSHAQNLNTIASGDNSSACGQSTTSQGFNQYTIGRFNVLQGTVGSFVAGDDAFIIGNGTSTIARANAFSVSNDGKVRTQIEVYQPPADQVLGAGFIIAVTRTYQTISSAALVTSDPTTPIAAGSEVGQQLILDNDGANDIELLSGGNVDLPGNINYTINPKGTISFVWTAGNTWRCIGASAN